jgi:hypothetical protein
MRSHIQIANTLCLENVLKDFNILEGGDGGGEMRNSAKIAGGAHPVDAHNCAPDPLSGPGAARWPLGE